MLPTPSTSHVDFNRIYEPAEDSYLLLDTFSSAAEKYFLGQRFGGTHLPVTQVPAKFTAELTPLILEIGTGSGVVLAFITANANAIFGRRDVLAIGTDVNDFACRATKQTVLRACQDVNSKQISPDGYLEGVSVLADTVRGDLASPLRHGSVDVLIFNPPYVPTEDISPAIVDLKHATSKAGGSEADALQSDTDLLSLSYAGGVDGMEVTNRLLDELPNVLSPNRGVAYILLCRQNKPNEVVQRLRRWGNDWSVAIVGSSGKQGGWEKLCILRISRVLKTE